MAPPQPLVRGVREQRTAHEHTYSRWHAGPTTFRPLGRVLSTILVLSFGPWTGLSFFALLWTPVWVLLATILLRQIWRREPVVAPRDVMCARPAPSAVAPRRRTSERCSLSARSWRPVASCSSWQRGAR
jgi:hypothetical protein